MNNVREKNRRLVLDAKTLLLEFLAAVTHGQDAGALFAATLRAWPLVICGVLKIAYDLLLLIQFRHVKPPEEQ